jgi:hypothetical protein
MMLPFVAQFLLGDDFQIHWLNWLKLDPKAIGVGQYQA